MSLTDLPRRSPRRTVVGFGLLTIGLISIATLMREGSRAVPGSGIATPAQLASFVDTYRSRLPSSIRRVPGSTSREMVIELPARPTVQFLSPPRATNWYALGGRFSPKGTLTLPNADAPFLFAAMEMGGATHARFALLAPKAQGIAPVPNAHDLAPVVVIRGEDRTVWTGRLARVGDRYPLPERIGGRGLAIQAGDSPAPRIGELAPLRLPRTALPPSGILLGQTMLLRRVGPLSDQDFRTSSFAAFFDRFGIRLPFSIAWDRLRGRTAGYELRTIYHVYHREDGGWARGETRVRTSSANTIESDDAEAMKRFKHSPVPTFLNSTSDEPFGSAQPPGSTFARYRW